MLTIVILILAFPSVDDDTPEEREVKPQVTTSTERGRSNVESYLEKLREKGFKIKNKMPAYIMLEKDRFPGNPANFADRVSKEIYAKSGERIKVIIKTRTGKYIGSY